MNTKRFAEPIRPLDGIIRHLVQDDKHGPISAFEVFRRAAQLRNSADETQVAACVQAVLINYNWLTDADVTVAQSDVAHALGLPMSIGRNHGKRG